MVWGGNGDIKPYASGGSWCGAGKSPAAGTPVTPKQNETGVQASEGAEKAAEGAKKPP